MLNNHHLETHEKSPYSYIYRSKKQDFHALIRTYQHGVSLSRFKINFIEKYSDGFLQHLLVYFYILWLQWHYFTNRCTTLIFTKIDTIIQTIFYQIIYSKNLQVGMNKILAQVKFTMYNACTVYYKNRTLIQADCK